MNKKLVRAIIPLAIIAFGIGVTIIMASSRKAVERKANPAQGILVRVQELRAQPTTIEITAFGTVDAARSISLSPQVSGEVIQVHPAFVAGGFCSKGDEVVRIDPSDHRLRVEMAEAGVRRAEYEVGLVEAQLENARREWASLKQGQSGLFTEDQLNTEEQSPLKLYELQNINAQASLQSARASLAQAKLDLSRTVIRVPFDCRVQTESVDVGFYIKAGSTIATIYDTSALEITAMVPITDLQWLDIPRTSTGQEKGSPAIVMLRQSEDHAVWEGNIVRSLGVSDPKSRLIGIVVRIEDPYQRGDVGSAKRPDLRINDFVTVRLTGRTVEGVWRLPRDAIHENQTVRLTDGETLEIRRVELLTTDQDSVIVSSGLKDGDLLVTTPLTIVVPGMKLRVHNGEASS